MEIRAIPIKRQKNLDKDLVLNGNDYNRFICLMTSITQFAFVVVMEKLDVNEEFPIIAASDKQN